MFPFHRGDDELFEIHPDNNNINIIIPMTTTAAGPGATHVSRTRRSKSSPTQLADADHPDHTAKNETDRRKVAHREIERQRREEMSNLYSSLRSQLPVEYIKGKRSISDHMNGAVNYINHQQNRIKELSLKRDELRRISTSRLSNEGSPPGSTSFVQVGKCWGGVEIVVIRGYNTPLPTSKVLHTLQEDGFIVNGYVSATINQSVIYTIQAQVGDDTWLDLPRLEAKLSDIIS